MSRQDYNRDCKEIIFLAAIINGDSKSVPSLQSMMSVLTKKHLKLSTTFLDKRRIEIYLYLPTSQLRMTLLGQEVIIDPGWLLVLSTTCWSNIVKDMDLT